MLVQILSLAAALASLLPLVTASSSANEPVASATVSSTSVQVAEPFTLEIIVRADQGTKVTFPDLHNELGPFEIRNVHDAFDVPHANDPALRTWTRSLTLDSIETGDLLIPPLNLQLTQATGVEQLSTQPIAVRVVSVLEDRSDPTQFRDIQSVVDVPLPDPSRPRTVPWGAVTALSLLGLAVCVGALVYRSRRGPTASKWALSQLDALDSQSPTVAVQLTQILHEFLLLQFELPEAGSVARGRSSPEIIQSLLSQHRIEASIAERLATLFELTDQAKFAGLRLSARQIGHAIAEARQIVRALGPLGKP